MTSALPPPAPVPLCDCNGCVSPRDAPCVARGAYSSALHLHDQISASGGRGRRGSNTALPPLGSPTGRRHSDRAVGSAGRAASLTPPRHAKASRRPQSPRARSATPSDPAAAVREALLHNELMVRWYPPAPAPRAPSMYRDVLWACAVPVRCNGFFVATRGCLALPKQSLLAPRPSRTRRGSAVTPTLRR